ncbi:MAG: hypothetical protein AOA66_0784 [Candidatus Bathyarchaeota archaeon BA2]|nr:MAG: hypothetical protein AOA66_0784 [Candidatus Bathyarchaeota archaeon BA2]
MTMTSIKFHGSKEYSKVSTHVLAAGLHELFMLGEDYVSMLRVKMESTWLF